MPAVTTADLEAKYIAYLRRCGVDVECLADLEYDPTPFLSTVRGLSLVETLNQALDRVEVEKPRLMNSYWRARLADLVASMPDQNYLRRLPIYIGELPTAEFNAHLDRSFTPDGVLVLIRRGLALLLFRFALIYMSTCQFRYRDGGHVLPPTAARDEARSLMRADIAAYLLGQHMLPIRMSGEVHLDHAVFLTTAMEQFVISHELGHAVTAIERSAAADRTTADSPQVEELVADALGAALCQGWADSSQAGDGDPLMRAQFGVLAPFLTLSVIDAIEHANVAAGSRLSDTHPRAVERQRALLNFQLQRRGIPESFVSTVEHACENANDLFGMDRGSGLES